MSDVGKRMSKEYSDQFDKLRQNRVEVSYHKYGPAEINYKEKLVDALKSAEFAGKPIVSLHEQIAPGVITFGTVMQIPQVRDSVVNAGMKAKDEIIHKFKKES